MKNQTVTVFFNIVPFIERNMYKYFIHILIIMGFALLIGFYSFVYLNKYEKDSKNLIDKKNNLGRRLNDLFISREEDGYEIRLINLTKKALNSEQKKGKFVDLEKGEDEIFHEVEMYVNNHLERLRIEVEEEEKLQRAQRKTYMSKPFFR